MLDGELRLMQLMSAHLMVVEYHRNQPNQVPAKMNYCHIYKEKEK